MASGKDSDRNSGAAGGAAGGKGPRPDPAGRKTRMVSLVIAATMILWLGGNFIGGRLGLPGRYAVLFDLLALAGFVWSLAVIYQIWRARRQE